MVNIDPEKLRRYRELNKTQEQTAQQTQQPVSTERVTRTNNNDIFFRQDGAIDYTRTRRPNLLQKYTSNFVAPLAYGTIGSISSAAEGVLDFSNFLRRKVFQDENDEVERVLYNVVNNFNERLSEGYSNYLRSQRVEPSKSGITRTLTQGAGSVGGFFIPAIAVGKTAKLIGLAPKAVNRIVLGTGFTQNVGSAYNETIERLQGAGFSEEQIDEKRVRIAGLQSAVAAATNVIGIGRYLRTSPTNNKLAKDVEKILGNPRQSNKYRNAVYNGLSGLAKGTIRGGIPEGAEEGAQCLITELEVGTEFGQAVSNCRADAAVGFVLGAAVSSSIETSRNSEQSPFIDGSNPEVETTPSLQREVEIDDTLAPEQIAIKNVSVFVGSSINSPFFSEDAKQDILTKASLITQRVLEKQGKIKGLTDYQVEKYIEAARIASSVSVAQVQDHIRENLPVIEEEVTNQSNENFQEIVREFALSEDAPQLFTKNTKALNNFYLSRIRGRASELRKIRNNQGDLIQDTRDNIISTAKTELAGLVSSIEFKTVRSRNELLNKITSIQNERSLNTVIREVTEQVEIFGQARSDEIVNLANRDIAANSLDELETSVHEEFNPTSGLQKPYVQRVKNFKDGARKILRTFVNNSPVDNATKVSLFKRVINLDSSGDYRVFLLEAFDIVQKQATKAERLSLINENLLLLRNNRPTFNKGKRQIVGKFRNQTRYK